MFSINGKLKYCLLVILSGLIFGGCNVINPAEPTPTYVHVDSFLFQNTSLPLGITSSHQINSVWAYYNNTPIGVFDLPATIPVITGGQGQLALYPGIAVDGQNNFLSKYPFYKPDTFTLVPQPGNVINCLPKTSYYPDAVFNVFSNANNLQLGIPNFKLASGSSGMGVTTLDSLEFDGHATGIITLNAATNDTMSEDSSVLNYPIPQNVDAYIEFDYKNSAPFSVGLRPNFDNFVQTVYLNGAYPSDHWQKFYLAVKDFAAQYKGNTYQVFIKAYLLAGQASGKVLITNVQLVHY